jgi:exodeoxyribonuclease VII large subunit
MEQFALSFEPEPEPKPAPAPPPAVKVAERNIYSLRELSDAIRGTLERSFTNIWIAGEISSCKLLPSGHCYFTLKDSEAQIKCVCWKLTYWRLKFKPKDGMQVLVRGRVDIYEQRSEYQYVVEAIEPQGDGALQIAFDKLKQRLLHEGLFEAARKRPLPKYPARIGIVTSPQGAVIRDFVQILSRRFPGVHIRLFPARVQGPGAIEDVCKGIAWFGDTGWAQVIVLARGGGSLEDLWTFNEEAVARAIFKSPVPVVSAIGHETDITIADFVADLRAPTPSAAAELVVCTRQELLDRAAALESRMTQLIRYRMATLSRRLHEQAIDRASSLLHRGLSRRAQRVDDAEERLRTAMRGQLAAHSRQQRTLEEKLRYFDLRPRLRRSRERLNVASGCLETLMQAGLNRRRQRFQNLNAELNQMNPRKVLARGYSIVLNNKGAILKTAADAPAGTDLRLLFAEDSLLARVIVQESE